MKEKMSVSKAMAELRIIVKRIEDIQNSMDFVACRYACDKHNLTAGTSIDEFNKRVVSNIDKLRDLERRYNKIKSAINISNAKTTITIDEETMTIVEALERKRNIDREESFIVRMRRQLSEALSTIESTNTKLNDKISESKHDDKMGFTEVYEKSKLELVDPLNIKDFLTKRQESLDKFTEEVDMLINESNVLTEIEIDFN